MSTLETSDMQSEQMQSEQTETSISVSDFRYDLNGTWSKRA